MSAKNIIGGTFEDIDEAIVKPVADEVGKALEQGVQTVVSQPKPQQPTDRNVQLETQSKLTEARRKIEWWKKLDEEQKRVRELERQKVIVRTQDEQQDKESQQIKQFEIVKKKENLALNRTQRKTEIKGGVGG